MTVLGDGSGDASTTGVAPEANLVMYALTRPNRLLWTSRLHL